MSDTQPSAALPILIEISKIDVILAGLIAQRKQLEGDLAARRQGVSQQDARKQARSKLLEEKRALVSREEKTIKAERDKLNERRRALGTLNNYKLQQAAEREIDYASKQLGQREDILLGVMRDVEGLEKETSELESGVQGLRDELAAFEKEASENIDALSARITEHTAARTDRASTLGQPALLTAYDRIRNRYPMNPVVEVLNRVSCGGCHMKLGPQVFVQVARNEIVKCPGCSRFLRLGEEAKSE